VRAALILGVVILVGLVLSSGILPLISSVPFSAVHPLLTITLLLEWPPAEVRWLLLESIGIGSAIAATGLLIIWLWPKKQSLHGDARWATWADIKKADPRLSEKRGIFIGGYKGKYLRQGGQGFVLLAAGTRQGKGVSLVIPNCLTWGGSLVVTDVKLENYAITSGFREACGHKVYLFAPGSKDSHCWNPLDAISKDGSFKVADLQNMATLLVVAEKEMTWVSDARQLFLGVALLILDNPELPFTMGEMYRQLNPADTFAKYHKEILAGDGDLVCQHPDAHRIMSYFSAMNTKQFDGVKSHVNQILQIFVNPLLDAATSRSDFDLATLRKEKQTIYLGINPKDVEAYSPLLRLFYQQLVNVNIAHMPTKDDPYQVLLLMDEFPALGRMPALVNAVSVMAGYNLRFVAIVQSIAQLRALYRDETDTLLENIHTRVFFAAKNLKNAQDITGELGDTTVESRSHSRAKGFSSKLGNETISQAKRALLLPQEAKAIGQDAMIVLTDNCNPIMAKKVIYHRTKSFLLRCIKSDAPAGLFHGLLRWLFRTSNLSKAKRTKTQEAFMEYVWPPAAVPRVTAIMPKPITDPLNILPTEGFAMENIDDIAKRFVATLIGEDEDE